MIALLKNHVLKIFLAFFNFRYLKNKPWLPPHILSEIYKLLEKFNLFNSLDLFFIIFLLFITLYFSFLLLNLMMTFSFFLRRWHASRLSGYTSFPVKDSALQTSRSNSLFDISRGTREISMISLLKYWALSRDDRSKSIIHLRNNELQVLEICNSEKTRSNFVAKLSIFFVRSFIFSDKLSKLKSSSISSSLDSSFNLLLVKTMLVNS